MIRILCSFLFMCTALSFSANAVERPLRELVTYEQFIELLQLRAAYAQELQSFWSAQRPDFYWIGGTPRGLMHEIYRELQTKSFAQLKAEWNSTGLFSLNSLQLPGGVDVDLVVPNGMVDSVRQTLAAGQDWDLLSWDVYQGQVSLGGPTIEKMGLNPNSVIDPYQGLRHYYEGRLVFHWTPEEEFRSLPYFLNEDNSKTVEALRFIRFLYNLPELTPDTESINAIRNIADLEIPYLANEDKQIWIEMTLEKLFKATGKDTVETLSALREYNILKILAHYRIRLYGPDAQLVTYVDGLVARAFSLTDLLLSYRVLPAENTVGLEQFVQKVLPMATTAALRLQLANFIQAERQSFARGWTPAALWTRAQSLLNQSSFLRNTERELRSIATAAQLRSCIEAVSSPSP